MRQKLSRTLRAQFERSLVARLPEFIPERMPWGKQYTCTVASDLKFVVYMYPDRATDSFNVEVGWLASTTFLAAKIFWFVKDLDRAAPDARIRLDALWEETDPTSVFGVGRHPRTAHDSLDRSEEELVPEAREKAKFAVQQVIEHAVPLFREIAALRGHEVDFIVQPEGKRQT